MTKKQRIIEAENILTNAYDYIGKYNAIKYLKKEHDIAIDISVIAWNNTFHDKVL